MSKVSLLSEFYNVPLNDLPERMIWYIHYKSKASHQCEFFGISEDHKLDRIIENWNFPVVIVLDTYHRHTK